MSLQTLKMAMITYVNSVKSLWSDILHPLTINTNKRTSVKDYRIYGNSLQNGEPSTDSPIEIISTGGNLTKNLFYTQRWYPSYINNEFGITYSNKDFLTVGQVKISLNYKDNTAYTFSYNYEFTNATNNRIYPRAVYTDGSSQNFQIPNSVTGSASGRVVATTNPGKTLEYFALTYSTSGRSLNVKLSNMQIEEGLDATDFVEATNCSVPVLVKGKNILDMSKYEVFSGYYSDGQGNPSGSNANFVRISPIVIEPLKQYTMSSNLAIRSIWFYNENTSISKVTFYRNSGVFIPPADCTHIRVSLMNTSGLKDTSAFKWAMIEEGVGDGVYSPYEEPQTFHIYLNEPLRKVGEYADYIDYEKQKIIRNIKKETIAEIETMSSSVTSYRKFITQISEKPLMNVVTMSNKFKSYDGLYATLGKSGGVIMPYITTAGLNTVALTFNNAAIQTIESAQAAIGDGFDVYYVLAEPVEESLILPKLPQFRGASIYESQTEVPPSGIEVCYYSSL